MDAKEKKEEHIKINEYIYIAEAAELLGINPGTLGNWSRKKKIPVYYNPINNYRMYKKEELQKFLKQIQDADYKKLVKRLNRRPSTPKEF